MHKTQNEVTKNRVFPPGDVAEGGVKSCSAVGPEEVAEMVAEVGREGDIKSIFVVMVGPQALLQPRRFIKYRATQFEGWRGGKELLLLCSIAIYSLLHTRTGFEKEVD